MAPKAKAPSFPFFYKDWRSSRKVQRMSFKERGIYLELLIEQWDTGPLPNDPKALAFAIGAKDADFLKVWGTMRQCFKEQADGRLLNEPMEIIRLRAVEKRQRAEDSGRNGGLASAQARFDQRSSQSKQALHSAVPARQGSLPAPASIAFATAVASASAPAGDVGERAGRLRNELYPEWYAKHRNGARLALMANTLEFQDACTICETWDDPRIEKLAAIVLTTDDEWIAKTDRSFRIFARKASWADDRLREWEANQGKAS